LNPWSTLLTQADAFLEPVFEDDAAYLLFHDDADGCCAAALLLDLVATHGANPLRGFASPETHSIQLTPRLRRILEQQQPRYIIAVDLALTQSVDTIATLLNQLDARMLIYDHHIQSQALPWPPRCLHLNPLAFNLGNKPASWFAYLLHSHYTESSRAAWVAAVGITADYRVDGCPDVFDDLRRTYPALYPFTTLSQTHARRTPLMTLAHLVNAGYQHADHAGARLAVEALQEALQQNDPFPLLHATTDKAKRLHQYRKAITAELSKYLERFATEAEFHLEGKLAFFTMAPTFNITSQIATELQHRHPETIIAIIAPETPDTLKVSLRRGSTVTTNLAALAQATTAKLAQASGGGHPEAAGCVLRNDDLNLWKQQTLDHLRNAA
jgi:hypothetical protein